VNNVFLAFFLYESDVNMYINCTGTPSEVSLDCSIMRAERIHVKQITAENVKRVQLNIDVCISEHRD
jgi:hypothetical protein